MNDSGPYRELPKFLPCPRCGELLERAFEDVLFCMRCEGIWITPPTAAIAFGDPAWPTDATSMWWKSSPGCPECAHAGRPETMIALQAEGVQIDRCTKHGLWLDRGELGRVIHATGHELDVLRMRLLGGEPDLEKLARKREEWRKVVETRRHEAEEYRTRLDSEQKRRIAEAERRQAEHHEESERERKALEQAAGVPPVIREPELLVAPRVDKRVAEAEALEAERVHRKREAERQHMLDARMEIAASVAGLEREIRTLRSRLHSSEARLEGERMRLRMLGELIAKDD